jgi:cell filamentation protein
LLRNKVGATTVVQLWAAENDLVEYRLAELRERPWLVSRTYDLAHLKALHRQLFQDVYEWAGELRTVGLAKGEDTSFMPPFGGWSGSGLGPRSFTMAGSHRVGARRAA